MRVCGLLNLSAYFYSRKHVGSPTVSGTLRPFNPYAKSTLGMKLEFAQHFKCNLPFTNLSAKIIRQHKLSHNDG